MMTSTSKINGLSLVAAGSLALLGLGTGCQSASRMKSPVRAMWVTRFDYKSERDVKRIMENCHRANVNTVLFQVRGNGTAFYQSDTEPWADELGGTNPGFDPLTVACREAHTRGMKLQAWVNVMPAWRGTKPPTNPEQLYNKRPAWFWYDQNGKRQALSSFYVSLNPCLPDVRAYLVNVFREIVTRYDVDGLHMDYVRFPNEPPATPRGSGLDYPRDDRTLALYKRATGLTPDENKAAWDAWRTKQVTRLVADIRDMMNRERPKAALTAAVGSIPERGLSHFQDGRTWMKRGLVDAVFLMNYTGDPDAFWKRMQPWLEVKSDALVVPGLWFDGHLPTDKAIQVVCREIEMARDATSNFCIFAYSSLFNSPDDQITPPTQAHIETRRQRRNALLPFLATLDEARVAMLGDVRSPEAGYHPQTRQ